MSSLRFLAFACVVLFSALGLPAQVATGAYTLGTYDSLGADTINVGNLNVMFDIPVLHKPGRAGTNFTYDLFYNGSIWTPPANGSTAWVPDQNWGWINQTQALTGYISEKQITLNCNRMPGITTADVIYHDAAGVFHRFSGHEQTGSCPGNSNTLSGTWTTDGQYYYNSNGQISNVRGQLFTPPTQVQSGPGTYTDTNGNQITTDGNGNFTDTTGIVVLTVSGGAPSNQVYTYKDPNGTQRNITTSYTQYAVVTNFGCTGLTEYSATSVPLVNQIALPDGSSYSFTYEHAAGTAAGSVTGRLASVTLPTGGVVSYSYSGAHGGINCSDGSAIGLTRTLTSATGSPTRTYTRTPNGFTSHTAVVDEQSNSAAYDFVQINGSQILASEFYETARTFYQGSSGTPLLAMQTCYNQASQPCNTQVPTAAITQADTYQIWDGVSENGTTTTYNSSLQPTELENYDFGSSARGALLQTQTWQYTGGLIEFYNALNSSGYTISHEAYSYGPGTVTTSGIPNHVTTNGSSGNLVQIERFPDPANLKTFYSQQFVYYDTGSVSEAGNVYGMGVSGGQAATAGGTNFSYESTNSFPTSTQIVTNTGTLSAGATYDLTSGATLTMTDLNGTVTTNSSFDPYGRPQQAVVTAGTTTLGKATATYLPTHLTANSYQSSTTSTENDVFSDSYGRTIRSATQASASPASFYLVDACYDTAGRVHFQSYAYKASSVTGSEVCSGAGDTYSYDALGRTKTVVHADAGHTSSSYSYTGAASKVTDENGIGHIYQTDGMGRISIVCELSTNSTMPNSGSPVSCGTTIAGSGFLTTYAYGLNSVTVTQGSQTRTFYYDGLGRLTAKSESEGTGVNGGGATTSYQYAVGGSGMTTTRTTQRAGQTNASVTTATTYQYDALNRLTSISYNDGVTPTKTFTYDQALSGSPVSGGGSAGQLTSASTPASTMVYGYDALGRVNATGECLPGRCGTTPSWITRGYGYDWQSNQTSESFSTPGGTVNLGYTVNLAGQLLMATGGQDAAVSASLYSATGSSMTPYGPVAGTYGNGVAATLTYDALGRTSGMGLTKSSNPLYAWTASWSGSRVASANDSVNGGSASYTYDDMNRLSGATLGSLNLSWTYDRYGNRWGQGASGSWPGTVSQPSLSFSSTTNQVTSSGYAYDVAGNLMQDPLHTYTYDAEGNVTAIDGGSTASYTYDANNQRVEAITPAGTQEFGFNAAGQRATVWDGSGNLVSAQYFQRGKPLAYYLTADGHAHFQHQDWTGTERMRTTDTGTVDGTFISLPFGDGLQVTQGSSSDPYHFASLDQDAQNLEHASIRELSSVQGQWLRPDPYDGSYNFFDPQSMNRYAYVKNSPVSSYDPSGRSDICSCWFDGNQPGMSNGNLGGSFGSADDEFAIMNMPIYGEVQYGMTPIGAMDVPCGSNCLGLGIIYGPGWGYEQIGTGLDFLMNGTFNYNVESGTAASAGPGVAPNNGQQARDCGGILAKGAAQTVMDGIGILPEGGAVVEGAKFLGGFTSTAIAGVSGDATGASIGSTGLVVATTNIYFGNQIKGPAEALPVVGQFVAGAAALWDIGSTGYEYAKCTGTIQ